MMKSFLIPDLSCPRRACPREDGAKILKCFAKKVERTSAVCPTTRFPSLDGRGLRGGWSDKILISHQFYHSHPNPPPFYRPGSRGRAISGIAGIFGQSVFARLIVVGTARPPGFARMAGTETDLTFANCDTASQPAPEQAGAGMKEKTLRPLNYWIFHMWASMCICF
jgi:hypothetical protein